MCDLGDPASYADAQVVILGAPFDGGTSSRSGARYGPMAIRMRDYLEHDGSRPSLALRTDGLVDLGVVDAGDVEMYSGDIETALPKLEAEVEKVARAGAIPVVLGGDHSIAFPDAKGVANVLGHGRVSMLHFDAHADTGDIQFGSLWGHGQPMRRLIESGALRGDRFLQIGLRGYWPPPDTLDWMAAQNMRSYEMTEIGVRGLEACLTEAFAIATVEWRVPVGRHRRVRPEPRAGDRHPRAGRADSPPAPRLGTPDLPRAAGSRDGRGRGQSAVRPCRHHRGSGEPGCARSAVRHRPKRRDERDGTSWDPAQPLLAAGNVRLADSNRPWCQTPKTGAHGLRAPPLRRDDAHVATIVPAQAGSGDVRGDRQRHRPE
jgi:agmatinase